jgi:transposase
VRGDAHEHAHRLRDSGAGRPQPLQPRLAQPGQAGESTWDQRVKALNEAGYTRYQERTATMLGDLTEHLHERWGGDLRRLREQAGRDPKRERALLKQFKGIGDVGADIFLREVQVAWEEVAPFADRRVLEAAERLGLGNRPDALARLVGRRDFPRLVAALARVRLDKGYDEVERAARPV